MRFRSFRLVFSMTILVAACSAQSPSKTAENQNDLSEEKVDVLDESSDSSNNDHSPPHSATHDRAAIIKRLNAKKASHQPLIVDLHVPLCDNEHQGIIPVNSSLGDGFNLRTNLYWGAGYGIGYYFTAHKDWKLMAKISEPSPEVAEIRVLRAVYGADTVYLVARAYWGDQMVACLTGFFNSIGGYANDTFTLNDGSTLTIGTNVDMVGFNGHNGLMDVYPFEIPFEASKDTIARDVVVIGCVSHDYYSPLIAQTHGYPTVMTTNFMAPEAYVMEPIIRNWAAGETGEAIRLSAGDGYHSVQKCGVSGARRLFKSGW